MAESADEGAELDPHHLRRVFPDAHQIFAFKPKSLDEAFPNAVFVLDTNALLVPYAVAKTSLDDIGRRYAELITAKRLLVPAHVAREFANQRAEQIKTIYSTLYKARNQSRIRPDYAVLAAYHQFAEAEAAVDGSISARNKVLDGLLDRIRSWRWDDPVSELYRSLFTEDVVVESDLKEDEAKADCKRRSESRLPPGFRDLKKATNSAGDMLIWHTILTVGRARPAADVVLISGDAKNDWFYRSENTPLYPRFELTDEFRRESKGGSFHIMTLGDVLGRLEAPSTVVEEVKTQEAIHVSRRPGSHWGARAEAAVVRWLAERGYKPLSYPEEFPDFIAVTGAERLGVAVRLVSSRAIWVDKLRQAVARSSEVPPAAYERLALFFVGHHRELAERAALDLLGRSFRDGMARPVKVRLGFVSGAGEFIELSAENIYDDAEGPPLP